MKKKTKLKPRRSKLTPGQVRTIREMRTSGWKLRELAERYDMTLGNIGKICRYETWGHL